MAPLYPSNQELIYLKLKDPILRQTKYERQPQNLSLKLPRLSQNLVASNEWQQISQMVQLQLLRYRIPLLHVRSLTLVLPSRLRHFSFNLSVACVYA